jgi:hypothetical protein
MKKDKSPESIQGFFQQALRGSLHEEVPEVEQYLVNLLVRFLHQDSVFPILDGQGRRITSVAEMLEYGDVRLRAPSFKAERDVHRHVGDLLLFWSGVFPEFLPRLAAPGTKDMLLNCVAQGQMSYSIAGSFDHDPFADEARVLRRLSDRFVVYQRSLSLVRASFDGFSRQGWVDGFSA